MLFHFRYRIAGQRSKGLAYCITNDERGGGGLCRWTLCWRKHGIPASCLSGWRNPILRFYLERETGIGPATNSLEGCDSTTELLPLGGFLRHIGKIEEMELAERIELSTSPLPRECSATELRQPVLRNNLCKTTSISYRERNLPRRILTAKKPSTT
jgi:hypothetical protein